MMTPNLSADLITMEDLPQQLRKVTDVIGMQAALVLVQHYGGVRLYVPVQMTPEHILARLIGFAAALELAKVYGGLDHFDIPRAAGAMRVVRNRQIAEKYVKGKTLRQLALEYAMTERGVVKILATMGASQEDRQPALF